MPDDRQLLDDYVRWSTTKELDTSIDAFLAERKAEADAARVAEAIEMIGSDYPPPGYQLLPLPNDHMFALDTLYHALHILIDDRPTIDDSTFTERRTYLT